MSPSATPATQTATVTTAANGNQARHQGQPSAISATPAMQSDGRCHQVPRLPRKEPSAPPEPAQCHKRHTCHAKWRSMFAKCHACHANSRGDKGAKQDPSAPLVLWESYSHRLGPDQGIIFSFFSFLFFIFFLFHIILRSCEVVIFLFLFPNNVEMSFSFVYRASLMCS